jgi:glutamate dehydrogenase/leucine dehydrogenase
MRIKIRSRGPTLTKKQTLQLREDLGFVFARFGDKIDQVIVAVSASGNIGLTSCELEVQLGSKRVTVVCSDRDVSVAVGYAARRAARSVSRAIDLAGLTHR